MTSPNDTDVITFVVVPDDVPLPESREKAQWTAFHRATAVAAAAGRVVPPDHEAIVEAASHSAYDWEGETVRGWRFVWRTAPCPDPDVDAMDPGWAEVIANNLVKIGGMLGDMVRDARECSAGAWPRPVAVGYRAAGRFEQLPDGETIEASYALALAVAALAATHLADLGWTPPGPVDQAAAAPAAPFAEGADFVPLPRSVANFDQQMALARDAVDELLQVARDWQPGGQPREVEVGLVGCDKAVDLADSESETASAAIAVGMLANAVCRLADLEADLDLLRVMAATVPPADQVDDGRLFEWYASVAWDAAHGVRTGERSLSPSTVTEAHQWVANLRISGHSVDALFRRVPVARWERLELPPIAVSSPAVSGERVE